MYETSTPNAPPVDGGASRLAGGLARTAADVEDVVAGTNIGSGAELHAVAAQFGVVEVDVAGALHGHGASGPSRRTPHTSSSDPASGANSGIHHVAPAST
jgi:hypothetical protein